MLVRALLNAQEAAPAFTHVYAALLALINARLPEVGLLCLHRVIYRFRRAYRRSDKLQCISTVVMIAHLVNQQVAHELLALELVFFLLTTPTEDSVLLAVQLLQECGQQLEELAPQGLHAAFERMRTVLQEGTVGLRGQYAIEELYKARRGGWKGFPGLLPHLDLVEEDDQLPHQVSIEQEYDPQTHLDQFTFDSEYALHEADYDAFQREILGEEAVEEAADAPVEAAVAVPVADSVEMEDQTGSDDVAYRRQVYLTIMSSAGFEECAHKLLKARESGREKVLAEMVLECCMQERTYLTFYGLIGERFCTLHPIWKDTFEDVFADHFATLHRLELNKIRNSAKFYAHLLQHDALRWGLMEFIHISEEETTSSSRIFIKFLFQELAEIMGMKRLHSRLHDPEYAEAFAGLFPTETPSALRFAINFFRSIDLGPLTDVHASRLQHMLDTQQPAPADTTSEQSV